MPLLCELVDGAQLKLTVPWNLGDDEVDELTNRLSAIGHNLRCTSLRNNIARLGPQTVSVWDITPEILDDVNVLEFQILDKESYRLFSHADHSHRVVLAVQTINFATLLSDPWVLTPEDRRVIQNTSPTKLIIDTPEQLQFIFAELARDEDGEFDKDKIEKFTSKLTRSPHSSLVVYDPTASDHGFCPDMSKFKETTFDTLEANAWPSLLTVQCEHLTIGQFGGRLKELPVVDPDARNPHVYTLSFPKLEGGLGDMEQKDVFSLDDLANVISIFPRLEFVDLVDYQEAEVLALVSALDVKRNPFTRRLVTAGIRFMYGKADGEGEHAMDEQGD